MLEFLILGYHFFDQTWILSKAVRCFSYISVLYLLPLPCREYASNVSTVWPKVEMKNVSGKLKMNNREMVHQDPNFNIHHHHRLPIRIKSISWGELLLVFVLVLGCSAWSSASSNSAFIFLRTSSSSVIFGLRTFLLSFFQTVLFFCCFFSVYYSCLHSVHKHWSYQSSNYIHVCYFAQLPALCLFLSYACIPFWILSSTPPFNVFQ